MGAFLPMNLVFAGFFLFGIAWGWEGQEERQFFAILSSIFMMPLWFLPLYSIVGTTTGGVAFVTSGLGGWLPTGLLVNIIWWNVVLMYFTGAHMMQTLGRSEPVGKAIKKLRK